MIASVPYTGTHSLMKHLGESDYVHFPLHTRHKLVDVHVPVRDPLDTAVSWLVRYPPGIEHNMTQQHLNRSWDALIEYTQGHAVTFHKVEDLSQREHIGDDHRLKNNREAATRLDCVAVMRIWIQGKAWFFEKFGYDLRWVV